MAHKKAAASGARQHKNPSGKRLGVKLGDGQVAKVGSIIVRQRGTKISPGNGVKVAKDHSIYAITEGVVKYTVSAQKNGQKKVSVL